MAQAAGTDAPAPAEAPARQGQPLGHRRPLGIRAPGQRRMRLVVPGAGTALYSRHGSSG